MKMIILSVVVILAISGIAVYLAEQPTGMGIKRLYVVAPDPETVGKMCARQIHCKNGLTQATARAVGYDEANQRVTCECPGGRQYQLSAMTYTFAGFQQ